MPVLHLGRSLPRLARLGQARGIRGVLRQRRLCVAPSQPDNKMDLIFSAALVSLFILAAALAWPVLYALWSRVMAADTRELNFWRLVRSRNMTPKDFAGRERDLNHAMYRCIGCHEAARCDAALAEGRTEEVDAFCPNRRYLDELAATHRRA